MAHHYSTDIPSLQQSFPQLPAFFGNVNLNVSIQAGDPINPEHRQNAKSVTEAMKNAHDLGFLNAVTLEVVQAAELREFAVESAHSMAIYMPGNIAQELVQVNNQLGQLTAQVGQLNGQVRQLGASCENLRIIARNQYALPANYQPLLKTQTGHGLDIAITIFGDVQATMQHLVPPAQEPQVGTAPPAFSTNFHGYTRADIIMLIIFYNETFGIVAGDTVPTCVDKFKAFLTLY